MSVTHSLSEDTGPIFSLSPRKKIEDDDRNYTHCSIKAEYGLDLFLPLLVFKHDMRMLNTGLSKESMPPTVR